MSQSVTLARSLQIQLQVIQALLMREVLTRYGRHNIGFLWLFVEPMLFTLGVTALWSMTKATHGSNLPIVAFAVTGYSSVLLWRNMPGRCIGAVEPNLSLMYHRNVRVVDIFAARIFLEAIGGTTSFVILTLTFIAIGWMEWPEDVLKIALGWILLIWFGASLALLLGSMAARHELVEKLWHPLAYLTFPLSGALFMVEWLPEAARNWLLYVPMVNCVELLREGYFGSAVHAHYDVAYVAKVCAVFSVAALAQERIVSRNVTPE
jgi:ABC-type polysaccharide/polyol phosphate export permease